MKESDFIAQNKEKWTDFEKTYASAQKDPEILSSLYLDITEDLGYAQTFYRQRTIRAYLNELARKVFLGVHRQGQGEKKINIIHALTVSLPLELYRARKSMLFSLVAFLLYVALGVVTTYFYPEFPRTIMGDNYVDQTLINIEYGTPLAIYESESPLLMFYDISTNNLQVAFFLFIAGLLATLGTHVLLFTNGIMLGSFQMFFHAHGLLSTSFLGIWIHGSFEISSIIIAAGAGIAMGNGWLFPKSYTRRQSLQNSTVRGVKIMMTLIPFIIFAGFLESFVTHNYQMLPTWSKWGIILFSFAVILTYYVLYPFIVAKKHPHLVDVQEIINTPRNKPVILYKIRTVWATLQVASQVYVRLFKKIVLPLLFIFFPISLIFVIFQDHVHQDLMHSLHWFDWYVHAKIIFGFGISERSDFIVGACWSLLLALLFAIVFWHVKSMDSYSSSPTNLISYLKRRFVRLYLSFLPFYALFFFSPIWFKPFIFFILPLFSLNIAYIGLTEDKRSPFLGSLKFGFRSYRYALLIIILFSCVVAVAIQPIASLTSIYHDSSRPDPWLLNDLLDLSSDFIYRVGLSFFPDKALYYANVFRQCVYLLFVFVTLPFFIILLAFSYFSNIEKQQVFSLRKGLEMFGMRKKSKL